MHEKTCLSKLKWKWVRMVAKASYIFPMATKPACTFIKPIGPASAGGYDPTLEWARCTVIVHHIPSGAKKQAADRIRH